MELFLDCLSCALRQVLDASRMATKDKALQRAIMAESIEKLSDFESHSCAPDLVRDLHQIVKAKTGVSDPYRSIKENDIAMAKQVTPLLNQLLEEKEGSLYWALKIAATGNVLDSAIYRQHDFTGILKNELHKEFMRCDDERLNEKLKTAKRILIIGDNAGETVFDRVLLARLKTYSLTYAVRSAPIINDATEEDAYRSGLGDYAKIISTGCNAPGAFLKECNETFLNEFTAADVIISKGQGNFEALSDECGEIFFLLKAKCPMIAERLNVPLLAYVFYYQNKLE